MMTTKQLKARDIRRAIAYCYAQTKTQLKAYSAFRMESQAGDLERHMIELRTKRALMLKARA